MTARQDIDAFRALLEGLHAENVLLAEDVGRTIAYRFFNEGSKIGVEPVIRRAFDALPKALADHPELARLMTRFEKSYLKSFQTGAGRTVALDAMRQDIAAWNKLKADMLKKDRALNEDLVNWLERDFAERGTIAERRAKATETPKKIAPEPAPPSGKPVQKVPTKPQTPTQEAARKAAQALAEQKRLAYESFVVAISRANPEERVALFRICEYFDHDDPLWDAVASTFKKYSKSSDIELANAIQGVIGEALAMRNVWVLEAMSEAVQRAERIAAALGKDWEVVFYHEASSASATAGGLKQQLYDSSIWIVKKGDAAAGDVLEAAPIFVLEVKSGSTKKAVEQVEKGFAREFEEFVHLPIKGALDDAGKVPTQTFKIKNLRELLDSQGIAAKELGDLSTHRLLVAPRPSSERRFKQSLPKGVALEFTESLLSKREANVSALAFAKALKKTMKQVKKYGIAVRLGALVLGVLGAVDSFMVQSGLTARQRALGYGQEPWASASG